MNRELWLLLLHQIPPVPAYSRAQALRRLAQIGALPVKNSAYLLPDTAETLEDFQWVYREILERGGQAWLFRTEVIAGFEPEEIRQSFRRLREPDYQQLIQEAEAFLQTTEATELDSAIPAKLARRAQKLNRIDFFEAPGRKEFEELMRQIEDRLHQAATGLEIQGIAARSGRVWVTRNGIKVDRIGSAWLILRFIDQYASFRFVDPKQHQHHPEEVRFDMFEGEFTHVGDLCTFEVLIAASNLTDPALRAISEIVHDIDLKDERYQRPETSGIVRLLDGICSPQVDDETRLERGCALFDSLYESFKRTN